jgi:hypothetical protein
LPCKFASIKKPATCAYVYAYRTREAAGIGCDCGLGASPTPGLRESARAAPRARKYRRAARLGVNVGCNGVQETVVSCRAQRLSHLWHILTLVIPVVMCITIRPCPCPSSNAILHLSQPSSGPKPEEETRRLRLASLLHPRGLRHCPVRPRPRPSGFTNHGTRWRLPSRHFRCLRNVKLYFRSAA